MRGSLELWRCQFFGGGSPQPIPLVDTFNTQIYQIKILKEFSFHISYLFLIFASLDFRYPPFLPSNISSRQFVFCIVCVVTFRYNSCIDITPSQTPFSSPSRYIMTDRSSVCGRDASSTSSFSIRSPSFILQSVPTSRSNASSCHRAEC